MRKAQKQEIQNILKNLRKAHEEIKAALYQNHMSRVQNMLCECQEFAVSLGENIERLEGEGHPTVSCLEEYCELLFQVFQKINEGIVNENKIYKLLHKQLIRIINSARNDLQVKKEVLFLPYNASMWDSMESVWMAVRDDEECLVYVVAIPYFEKNPDGSFGKMHYEGQEYPEEVPITDWREYNVEERKPDVIYIQNPYDNWNLVTSVPPQYFSGELKKHTDMLVYLPYFVGIGNRVQGHLCVTPGVMNADRVIVESEKVRKVYIKNIEKFEKENNCQGAFGDLNLKILVRESPKIDRIRRVIDSGDAGVPEEWKAKLYRADGTRKKVILYNTTISAFLKYSDTYMEQLRKVLAIFRQEKEVVLLWRPHPLLLATVKSMRVNLYQEYVGIVKAYLKGNIGIYDDSANLDRAIVLSDAYYGDMSSVVELYKVTGKPIVIQDCG